MIPYPRIDIRLSRNFEKEFGPQVFHGYLIAKNLAAYVDGEALSLLRVKRSSTFYRQISGHFVLGFADSDDCIPDVLRLLNEMSAYELITKHLDWRETTMDLDFVALLE